MTYRRLNYEGLPRNRTLPEVFSEQDISDIFAQIIRCKNYWTKSNYAEWGRFMKMRDLCLIATLYLLGLRPNEACSLKFNDFNFQRMIVRIRGENSKAKKDRIIPVPKALINFFDAYFNFPRRRFWRGSKYLFPSLSHQHLSSSTLKTIMREKILKPIGLWQPPEKGKVSRFRCYTLRHSRASHILAKQIKESGQPDIFSIANILGHSDIRSSQVYLHTDKNYLDYLRQISEV